jgi:hypothetical protein
VNETLKTMCKAVLARLAAGAPAAPAPVPTAPAPRS